MVSMTERLTPGDIRWIKESTERAFNNRDYVKDYVRQREVEAERIMERDYGLRSTAKGQKLPL